MVALDLSPIQERMGPDRWSRRKEQVWEHLGRSLERRILGDESYQRITETGFIVALTGDILTMPGLPRVPSAAKVRLLPDGRIAGLMQND